MTGAVLVILLGSGALYVRWLRQRRQFGWLFGSAALWSALGGAAAYLALTGSV